MADARGVEPGTPRLLVPVARALALVNRGVVVLGMVALLLAALVLTSSVLSRYFLHASTDWQDETSVFLLVGATFLAGAFVQSIRGHVGIEAVSTILPRRANAYRQVAIDLVCMAFCFLFAWKSWTLLRDAWVDGQTTNSTWGPPLWIPYFLMAFGMSLLALQLLLQLSASANRLRLRLESH
ncbi:MAG: TRAP transporter small permease [Caldimonas sp.]|nr:TRAP transporter small permease [Pseudomonadota bacterium]